MKRFILPIFLSLLFPMAVYSQPKHQQIGEIILNDDASDYGENVKNSKNFGFIELEKEERKVTPYEVLQKETISYVESLKKAMESVANGGTPEIPSEPSSDLNQYFVATYYICSYQKVICPFFLEFMREMDLMASLNSGTASCHRMITFWKKWLSAGFQKRLDKGQLSFNQMNRRTEFKTKFLPKYSKYCASEVKKIMEASKADKTFFKKRYAGNSKVSEAVNESLDLLQSFKDRHIDVFATVNAGS